MNRIILKNIVILVVILTACTSQKKLNPISEKITSTENKSIAKLNNYIAIFEIPALEFERAVAFYQSILDIKIEAMDMTGMQMGLFPYEEQLIFGSIIKGADYKPSSTGVTIYLNGGDNLQLILDKVEISGGKIIVPKSPHGDDSGYFALFLDSEGNRIGLHSPN